MMSKISKLKNSVSVFDCANIPWELKKASLVLLGSINLAFRKCWNELKVTVFSCHSSSSSNFLLFTFCTSPD